MVNEDDEEQVTEIPVTNIAPEATYPLKDFLSAFDDEPDDSVPSAEEVFLRAIMEQLRRQAAKECRERFVAELKGVRDTVMTLIDVLITEYKAGETNGRDNT